jgi:hypothetical protein
MTTEEMQGDGTVALDYDAILAEYQHRQMIEHMVGPLISLVVHVVLIVLAIIFFVGQPIEDRTNVEVTIEEMDIKELEPKVMEELQKLEQLAEDVVPTVEKPEVPQEAVEVATDDFSDDMAQTDDAMDFSDVLDIRSSDTPLKISGLYGGRSNAGRKKQLKRFGGSEATETAVLRALRWLKKTQKPDGSWSSSQPQAMGGLALLAFLAHGETPISEEFGMTVQKAMQYLSDQMMAVPDSAQAGLVRAYVNGIVTYALSESYGLTKIPFLKPPMEKGLGFIVRGQQDAGGFDYSYKKGARWDLSVTGWQLQALKAGYVAGADVPGLLEGIDKGISFLKNVNYKDGKFGYSSPGTGSMGMQGAGTLCLQLLGEGNSSEARAGVKNISENYTVVWDNNAEHKGHSNPSYNWYYCTQAMFHAGQSTWRKWNKVFSEVMIKNQKRDGHWDCPGKGDKPEYDPWYTTTLCCLSLQVYYRYLPTYKMPKRVAKSGTSVLDAIDEDLGLDLD